jgi:hypothetical protein
MAADSNTYRSRGVDKNSIADPKKSGMMVDPGPYEAIVVGYVKDGVSLGQLRVSIPDFAATSYSIVTVKYASPFYGRTYGTDMSSNASGIPKNSPFTTGESYGMWMVPPDIGCKVLVTFVAGALDRGFWFACIYDSSTHHMVPGISRNVGGTTDTKIPTEDFPLGSVGSTVASNFPTIEYDAEAADAFKPDSVTKDTRYAHVYQSSILIKQGLDRDTIRGAISSSSMREIPSNVYGISTPGRKSTLSAQSKTNPDIVISRKGGHSFVMDDGMDDPKGQKIDGIDQLIRLRTTNGHQILMNDSQNVLYIASASGNQWLEFGAKGEINVYGAAGIHLRSVGPMDFHSDTMINMQAPSIAINAAATGAQGAPKGATTGSFKVNATNSISMNAVVSTTIASDALMSVSGGLTSVYGLKSCSIGSVGPTSIDGSLVKLNCGSLPKFKPALPATTNQLQDTIFSNNLWIATTSTLSSICTVVPSHEPWTTDGIARPSPKIPGGSVLGSIGTSVAINSGASFF